MQNKNNYWLKANQFYQSGDYKKAKIQLSRLLKVEHNNSEATHLLGIIYYLEGNLQKAIDHISKAISINPKEPSFYINLGNSYQNLTNYDKAQQLFEQAIILNPKAIDAYYNLGNLFLLQQQLEKAQYFYQQVILLNPNHINALHNLAVIFQKQNNLPEALNNYIKILAIIPNDPDCLSNIGIIYKQLDKAEDAKFILQQALKINQRHSQAHNNLGNIYIDENNLAQAIYHYEQAVRNEPTHGEQLSNLFFCLLKTCNWKDIKLYTDLLQEQTMNLLKNKQKPLETPFINVARCEDPEINYLLANAWANEINACTKNDTNFTFHKQNIHKINLGYLSYDFHDHPTSHLILGLFRYHNKENFNIHAYGYGPDDQSYYREEIKNNCDVFRDCKGMSSKEIATIINQDQIDILIDLKGFTKKHRLDICAYRPAPIQITYLGFPGTSGANFFDYIITDNIVTPNEHKQFYTEKIIYLPHCYQICDNQQKISSKPKYRSDYGLPNDSFVFCSFNQSYKIEPEMFNIWMQCMKNVSNSYLWLLKDNDLVQTNILNEVIRHNIDPKRIVFATREEKSQHLARLQLADLMLDTRIYNGHTTTNDALWAGIPVITMQGTHFASRVSSSILQAIGLTDCITYSLEEYKNLAITLANNKNKMFELKNKIKLNKTTYPLFNTKLFVNNLETAYTKIFQSYMLKEKPGNIEIIGSVSTQNL